MRGHDNGGDKEWLECLDFALAMRKHNVVLRISNALDSQEFKS